MSQIRQKIGMIFGTTKTQETVTKEEVQEMIDAAIRKHNRNASIISMCVGWVVLALFAEGLLREPQKKNSLRVHDEHEVLQTG